MFSKKEIEIYESDRSISIVLDWFTPIAYFLAFFSTIWCGFLIVWYSIVLAGGAPLIAALFPLIHVAVGIGLAYYTLCLFRNKTYIDIDQNYLSVAHKPIPWWKGNKELLRENIAQLYVKEKISRGKNGTSTTYQLRAKLRNGKDEEIFNLASMESHQVLEIEQRLERFMGIPDEPVRGEYAESRTVKRASVSQPRKQRQNFSPSSFAYLYTSRIRDYINYKNEEFGLSAVTQYDWNNGDSDKFFQLLSYQKKAKLIYVEQNKALLTAFLEEDIPIGKTGLSVFPKDKPPANIEVDGKRYFIANTKKGNAFVTGVSREVEISQWLYESNDKSHQIRFVDYDGQLSAYQGTKLSPEDFEKGLDLNNPPQKEEERIRNWDEEDFV